jgi:hypothetical protein
MVPPMRRAAVLVILAACGGADFTVDPTTPCPTCAAGHVRVAARAPRRVAFSPDGARLVAYGDQHIAWLDADLGTTATADTDIPVEDYVAGPYAGPVASAPDGRAIAAVSGGLKSGYGSTMSMVGLDGGGSPTWHSTAVDASSIPPTWLFSAPDGTPIIVSSTISASLALGTQTFNGWFVFATLSLDDGSVSAWKVHSATRTSLRAAALAPDGGVALGGLVDGTLSLGGTAPDVSGDVSGNVSGHTLFLASLDPHGDGVWAKAFTGVGPVYVGSVATDGQHVYASGTYTTTLDLGDGHMLSSTAPLSEFVIALDGSGNYLWAITLPQNIGSPTLAPTPNGVLFSGATYDPVNIAGIDVPGYSGQIGVTLEIVNGTAMWLLTATGAGDHLCESVGTIDGRTYVMIDATSTDAVHTDFDNLSFDGEARILAQVVTTGGS